MQAPWLSGRMLSHPSGMVLIYPATRLNGRTRAPNGSATGRLGPFVTGLLERPSHPHDVASWRGRPTPRTGLSRLAFTRACPMRMLGVGGLNHADRRRWS